MVYNNPHTVNNSFAMVESSYWHSGYFRHMADHPTSNKSSTFKTTGLLPLFRKHPIVFLVDPFYLSLFCLDWRIPSSLFYMNFSYNNFPRKLKTKLCFLVDILQTCMFVHQLYVCPWKPDENIGSFGG